mgnify:FL=1
MHLLQLLLLLASFSAPQLQPLLRYPLLLLLLLRSRRRRCSRH